jgi:hypothetical protein
VGSALAALSAALAIRLAGNPLAGLPAGLWAATCPSLVFDSTLLTPDTYAAFFAMLALWLAAHLASGAALGTYVAAGVAVGLAAGSKYTALLAALSLVVAHFLREGVRGFVKPGIWLSGLASALAFLCSTPFALLDRHEFWKDLTFEWAHYTQGHAGVRGSSLSYYTNLIVDEVGIKLLFAPLCLLVASRSSKTAAAAVGAFSLCYFAFISRTEVHFGRNAVPLFAPLLALSSAGLWAGATRFVTRENVRTAAIAALTILTGIKPAHAAYESVVAHHDNLRAPAEKWIDDNLPPGSVVLIESYGPWVDPHKFRVVGVDDFGHTNQKQLWRDGVRYVVVSQQYYRRYLNDPKKYPREFKRYEWLLSRRCVLFDSRVPYREIQVVDTQCEPP